MTLSTIPHPPIVSRDEWLAERKKLLAAEKELTKHYDRVNAERRRLPMVEIEKEYFFEGHEGKASLCDLFDGRRQLIVYHFMFDPNDPPPGKSGSPWDEGCPRCSFEADQIPHLSHLHARDTSFTLISRAPQAKIKPFKARMGWTIPWYSSFGSDFNYDFHVTIDEAVAPVEYNYQDQSPEGEQPGLSVFLRIDDRLFHTYSAYARGLEQLLTTYHMLDLTAYGRMERWEDSPAGWPQIPGKDGKDWVMHHDKYGDLTRGSGSCCS
jgi:predicted dithiol-disulfide oxidoreductase (DUF899 family)